MARTFKKTNNATAPYTIVAVVSFDSNTALALKHMHVYSLFAPEKNNDTIRNRSADRRPPQNKKCQVGDELLPDRGKKTPNLI